MILRSQRLADAARIFDEARGRPMLTSPTPTNEKP